MIRAGLSKKEKEKTLLRLVEVKRSFGAVYMHLLIKENRQRSEFIKRTCYSVAALPIWANCWEQWFASPLTAARMDVR
jgi:hypothetical protein